MAVQSTITYTGLMDRVRGDLGLRSNNLVTDADLLAWSNEASDTIAREGRWYRPPPAAVNVTAGTAEYDLPALAIAVTEVRYNSYLLVPVRHQDLRNYNPAYPTQSNGTPTHYYLNGNTALGVFPTPDTTSGPTLTVLYTALPPRVAVGADKYYVPYGGERAIIAYCCYRGSVKDAAGEGRLRMQEYHSEWQQYLADLVGQVNKLHEQSPPVMGIDADAEGTWGQWPRLPQTVTGN